MGHYDEYYAEDDAKAYKILQEKYERVKKKVRQTDVYTVLTDIIMGDTYKYR